MCSISGGLFPQKCDNLDGLALLRDVIVRAEDRGRDSFGICCVGSDLGIKVIKGLGRISVSEFNTLPLDGAGWVINNNRAEPTTEYVTDKSIEDIQPFMVGEWVVAHNGIIANDRELCAKYNLKTDTIIDSAVIPAILDKHFQGRAAREKDWMTVESFLRTALVGSYAIAIASSQDPDHILLMCNYKPLFLGAHDGYVLFSSLPEYLSPGNTIVEKLTCPLKVVQVPANTSVLLSSDGQKVMVKELSVTAPEDVSKCKALVVCSGGMDSTVVATKALRDGYKVTLLHFLYHCRAQNKEREAVVNIARRLGCDYVFIETDLFKNTIGGSRLTQTIADSGAVADGVAGAEFAHEWVPARNLIMLSIATGYAESKGYDVIMLGNNLEESGAYPDNEMIFIMKFAEVLPYAVMAGKSVRVEMPIGNLMKWEIVRLGLELGAPLDLCWSCYEDGDLHCGDCGPCYMRRVAFEINNSPDPINYLNIQRC